MSAFGFHKKSAALVYYCNAMVEVHRPILFSLLIVLGIIAYGINRIYSISQWDILYLAHCYGQSKGLNLNLNWELG